MTRNRSWWIVVLVWLVGAAFLPVAAYAQFPLPSPKPQATQAPVDPRVDQLKAGLEKQGLKVLSAMFGHIYGGTDPQWLAETAARYSQPNWRDVGGQAFMIWGAMYDVAAKDPPQTWFSGVQVWTKYGIALHTRLENLTTLVNDLNAAKTDAEKQTAFERFSSKVGIKIWDYERQVFVDNKDFTNKNFTS